MNGGLRASRRPRGARAQCMWGDAFRSLLASAVAPGRGVRGLCGFPPRVSYRPTHAANRLAGSSRRRSSSQAAFAPPLPWPAWLGSRRAPPGARHGRAAGARRARAALHDEPESADRHFELGKALYMLYRVDEAGQSFLKRVRPGPRSSSRPGTRPRARAISTSGTTRTSPSPGRSGGALDPRGARTPALPSSSSASAAHPGGTAPRRDRRFVSFRSAKRR